MNPSDPAENDLLDRERPLREIDAVIAEANARGTRAVVRITGPPGIGKTAVLHAVMRRRAGLSHFIGLEPATRVTPDPSMFVGLERVTTLAIDDAQWMHEVSARNLRAIARGAGDTDIVMADRRDESPELPSHHTVRLGPLRTSFASQLVRRHYPAATDALVAEIVDAAQGVPFAVEYLARDAARRAAHDPSDAGASVREALSRRLERCTAAARTAIRLCSLAGFSSNAATIARAADVAPLALSDALSEVGDLIIRRDDRIVFRHACIADAVADEIGDRTAYLTRLVEAFSTDDRSESLIDLLRCARAVGDQRTPEIALRVARSLAQSGAYATALEYAQLAVSLASRPVSPRYCREYAGILEHLQRDHEAAEFLRAQIVEAVDRRDAAAAARLVSSFCSAAVALERFDELESLVRRVEVIAEDDDKEIAAELRTTRLAALSAAGRITDFMRAAGHKPLRWIDHRFAALVQILLGDASAARASMQKYVAGLEAQHARHSGSDRALTATVGLWSIGPAALLDVDAVWGADSDSNTYATGIALRLIGRLADGRWPEADAIVHALPLDDPLYEEPYPVLDARLCFTALARRRIAQPQRTLHALRLMISRGRIRHAIAAACWYLVAAERLNAAVPPDIAAFVGDHLGVSPMPYLLGGIPLAVASLGGACGLNTCRDALERRDHYNGPWHVAHDDWARGLLSKDRTILRSARGRLAALGAPAFAMMVGLELPVPLIADTALARVLGFGTGAEAAGPKRELTHRENDIAQLAAQGASNREIASQLEISERTVETHLTSAFRKLGVRSRSGLARSLLGPLSG